VWCHVVEKKRPQQKGQTGPPIHRSTNRAEKQDNENEEDQEAVSRCDSEVFWEGKK
jgi:hypothetical protein